jgi:hypothetical protein|nr:MAG TPA: C2H2 type zinc-finger protein [Caudoviricetes sp.]
MKEVKLYQCEFCGAQFETEKLAKEHEQYHKKNLSIVGKTYERSDGFPGIIRIACEDPSLVAVYKYCWLTD